MREVSLSALVRVTAAHSQRVAPSRPDFWMILQPVPPHLGQVSMVTALPLLELRTTRKNAVRYKHSFCVRSFTFTVLLARPGGRARARAPAPHLLLDHQQC